MRTAPTCSPAAARWVGFAGVVAGTTLLAGGCAPADEPEPEAGLEEVDYELAFVPDPAPGDYELELTPVDPQDAEADVPPLAAELQLVDDPGDCTL